MRKLVTEHVEFYNTEGMHGGIGYKILMDKYLEYIGSEREVFSSVS